MTEQEARIKAMETLLGPLDDFERIAFEELWRETEGIQYPNVTPEQEKALMRLGLMAMGKLGI
jgi:hypothetical protein